MQEEDVMKEVYHLRRKSEVTKFRREMSGNEGKMAGGQGMYVN